RNAPNEAEQMLCRDGLAGAKLDECLTTCLCDTCPYEAFNCVADPDCRAIAECAANTRCDGLDCFKANVCGNVVMLHNRVGDAGPGTVLGNAVALRGCATTCVLSCPLPDAGPDAAAADGDATVDVMDASTESSDAPKEASDAPAEAAADATTEAGD